MKNNPIFCTLLPAIAFAAAFCFSMTSARAEGSSRPCELYTQEDAEALFNEKVSAGVMRETMLPAGESCRYTFRKHGSVFGVTVKVSTTRAIREEGIHDSAEDVFHRQVNARKSSAHAAKKCRQVQGLSDDAFWEGTSLYVLKGDILVMVTVHSVLEGSFTNREAMDAAHEKQNLGLSQEVAETVLSRLTVS